jgi:6-phosphofructokinase
MLATQLGTSCAEFIKNQNFGVMVAIQAGKITPVPIADVAGKVKMVPLDHSWLNAERQIGTCFGD